LQPAKSAIAAAAIRSLAFIMVSLIRMLPSRGLRRGLRSTVPVVFSQISETDTASPPALASRVFAGLMLAFAGRKAFEERKGPF
jgi:hypothetical protein